MLEVKTVKQMSTEEMLAWYKELDEMMEEMEFGSYEHDCASADLEYVSQCLEERGGSVMAVLVGGLYLVCGMVVYSLLTDLVTLNKNRKNCNDSVDPLWPGK